jgi:hypothetical protein
MVGNLWSELPKYRQHVEENAARVESLHYILKPEFGSSASYSNLQRKAWFF